MISIHKHLWYELGQAEKGLLVIFEILRRDISVIEYYKSFHWFFAYILENKCNGILLNSLRCMFDISYCDVIYYVIDIIWSHYVWKAINPLFAWPSSYPYITKLELIINVKYYTIIYIYRGKYDGLAPRKKQYSPSQKGKLNIASRWELNHRIYQKSKIIVLLHEFRETCVLEHICCINHKETSMTLSAKSRIWRETSRALYYLGWRLPRSLSRYIFAQPSRCFKQIGEGEIFHLCNKFIYVNYESAM